MAEVDEAVRESLERVSGSRLNSAVATMVAVSATFMAICNIKDSNVVQAMTQAQAQTIDTWAYYQAKSTKQHVAEVALDQLTIQRETLRDASAEVRALLERKAAEYKANIERYGREEEEIKARAEVLQREYDRLNVRDDQFDMAEATLSLAVALFGITALTQKRWLLGVAAAFMGVGFVLGLAGFVGWSIHPGFLARLLT